MKYVGLFIVGLLVAGAFAFWVRATVPLPHVQVPTIASLVGTSTSAANLTASAATVANTASDGNYVDITGTILIDNTGGSPVPFLEYTDANNKVATKQLVYADSRACAAYAGDLPCVDMSQESGYPEYPTGTAVEVQGEHVADRILVYEIKTL